ncbi:xanthine dehydrogenase family protein subunit M [Streptomyces sp. RKND-216]|uniref:FAD binding domain-containing protein n=1 Tax=Streptomyces sp. RKND-216 TaxID=2562581 RepID=UPI00109DFAEB|nr:xanthine dehydrogenase family protein subunit M [Streptomyces sp. RKND-216]THA26007.1 xanthine dehydrogenase family protein subunit M [Streptomyces sp. RKND-216]
MIPFEYHRATDAEEAVATVAAHPHAVFLAGGTNLVDHMKLGVAAPHMLVDVSRLPLDGIEETPEGGLRVGTAVRNSDLAAHPLVRERYPALSRALLSGASGQLRNAATTGGNLLQRTRCRYFQDVTTPCNKREPGSGCSAIGGWDRNHAVLGASDQCIAVHPSDMAVGLLALDATVHVLGPDGARTLPLAGLHRLPGDAPERDTELAHGELITAVELPSANALTRRSTYRKVRERASYAFALVSVAAALDLDEAAGTVRDVRIALGGVAHKPWRAERAEEALRGAPAREEAFRRAAETELAAAQPREGNAYKVPLARNTMVATLRNLTEGRR